MSSGPNPPSPNRLISQLLLEDADLKDIVVEFVNGLDQRLAELRQAFDRLDWDQLVTLAHRLKGAAGSYGYPEISRVCAALERSFRAHEANGFTDALAELNRLVDAARAGLPSEV